MLSMLALASSQKNTFNYCSTPHLPTMENASVAPQVGNPCDLGDENQSKLSRSDIQQVVCFCPCLYLECSPSDQWVWKKKTSECWGEETEFKWKPVRSNVNDRSRAVRSVYYCSRRGRHMTKEKKKIPKLRLTSHSPPWAHTHPDSFKLPLKLSCSTGNNQCFPRDKHYSCSHSVSEQPANFPHIYSCLWSGQLDVALHLTSDHGRKCPYCPCY